MREAPRAHARRAGAIARHEPRERGHATPIASNAAIPLVGRGGELAQLVRAFRDPSAHGAVLIGAPGVGKTRLARELAHAAEREGAAVELITATRAATGTPFGAVLHLLPPEHGSRSRDPLDLLHLAHEAVGQRAAGRRSVVLVDDAPLLDEGSAALVHYLALANISFVVVTVCAGDGCPDAIVGLWKDGHAVRVDVSPLPRAESAELLAAFLGGPTRPQLARWAFAQSEGNPLLLHELLLSGLSDESIAESDGWWELRTKPTLSDHLVELASARIAGLPREARRAMELVALGEPIDVSLVEELAGIEAMVALETSSIVTVRRESGRQLASATNPSDSEVTLRGLSAAHKRSLRIALADAVDRRAGRTPDERMRSALWRLDAGRARDAARLVAATQQALDTFDAPLAERFGHAAIEAGAGYRAAPSYAEALLRVGCAAEAEAMLGAFEPDAADDAAPDAYLAIRATTLIFGLGRSADALALLQRAETWSADCGRRLHVDAARVVALTYAGAFSEAARLGDQVTSQALLDATSRRRLESPLAIALALSGRTADAVRLQDRVVADLLADDKLITWLQVFAWALVRIEAGEALEGLEDSLEQLRASASYAGRWEQSAAIGLALGELHLRCGRASASRHLLEESTYLITKQGPSHILPIAQAMRAEAEARVGAPDAARETLADLALHLQGTSEHYWAAVARSRAEVAIEIARGDNAAAAAKALRAADACRDRVAHEAFFLHEALRAGHPASALAPRMRELASRSDSYLIASCAERAEAIATGDAPALERISARLEGIGMNLTAAEVAADASNIHARAGREGETRRMAAQSRRLGARCEGARMPAPAGLSNLELTSREREIATLAANGVSTPAIAERLFLSPRTVETHLQNAMRKLGVHSRVDLSHLLE